LDRDLTRFLALSALIIALFPSSIWLMNQVHVRQQTVTFHVIRVQHMNWLGNHTNVYTQKHGEFIPAYQFVNHVDLQPCTSYQVTFKGVRVAGGFMIRQQILTVTPATS